MAQIKQWRRGTAAENNNFTGAPGEITVDTTTNTLRVHDGQTLGGTALARADSVTDMTGADYVIDWQSPTADNGYTWYRKYKSGWVEQGGVVSTTVLGFNTVTLPTEMADDTYVVLAHCLSRYVAGSSSSHNYVAGKGALVNRDTITSMSFQVYSETVGDKAAWMVYGFGK